MLLFKKILLGFSLVCILSCNYSSNHYQKYYYPENPNISNSKGELIDSMGFYFSTFAPFDASQLHFVKDSISQNYIAMNLFAFKEPILNNYYLGRKIYRFLWLPSFETPLVISLNNIDGNISLTTKRLNRDPWYRDELFEEVPEEKDTIKNVKLSRVEVPAGQKTDPVIKEPIEEDFHFKLMKPSKNGGKIVYNETKKLTKTDWKKFEEMLEEAKFWTLETDVQSGATDGASWIIEAHFPDRYRFLSRQRTEESVRKIGEFLIKLCGLKVELY